MPRRHRAQAQRAAAAGQPAPARAAARPRGCAAPASTPLIPISDQVVVMPLVGRLDRSRVEHVLQTLLDGVQRVHAAVVILDITGVAVVDAAVADALVRTARAVGLLGARVVLTGIRPEVAATLAALGTDLMGLVTRGTLQDGIRHAHTDLVAPRPRP
ncbi:STAS domain-containing protein [Nannocystis pusilla]|uniref:STAS domain-containing protein n=2 Tax=Nannocystis pusilla TaxID=889268 RepID=A0A9X3EKQ5_9BACT|nr:STAS domain-containing protein [Nannocystis pusilla]